MTFFDFSIFLHSRSSKKRTHGYVIFRKKQPSAPPWVTNHQHLWWNVITSAGILSRCASSPSIIIVKRPVWSLCSPPRIATRACSHQTSVVTHLHICTHIKSSEWPWLDPLLHPGGCDTQSHAHASWSCYRTSSQFLINSLSPPRNISTALSACSRSMA